MKILVIFFTLFKLLCYISAQKTCKKVNSCKCKLDDGKVIDLDPLAKSSGPAFLDVLDSGGVDQYSWNPCKPFSEGGCTNAAVCQTHSGLQYNCGTQDSAVFGYDDANSVYTITYSAESYVKSNDVRTTTLYLYCDQGPDMFQPIGEAVQGTYALIFKGKYACPRTASAGISAGSILIIIFFSLLVVYLIGGVLFQIFVKKNSGKNAIPNSNFWFGLPGLIKDGVFLIIRRGGKKGSYNSI
ncbi:uncharacterized protein LOC133188845 [Saccostrea echinata]|uniref:uncharacterized protein LOC133188845 n=1 Tax=Saccostrea echinata TaxID=191078 RepID=UPI002A816E6F|nr:uncharacterized protein LOC133188845 [Saccostrea echinata]